MNLIKLIFNDLITQVELFQISDFIDRILKEYEEEGYIELEKFVSNSVNAYLNYHSKFEEKGSLVKLKPENSQPVFLRMPKILLLKLWWFSLKLKATKSEIINEALSYSIPQLIAEVEEMANYSLEIALKDN